MLDAIRFMALRTLLGAADFVVTAPAVRWSWTGLGDERYAGSLLEFRPSDSEAAREMMSGRYLLASKLIDTEGMSPFEMETDHAEWVQNLHGFSWLRHFRDLRDEDALGLARLLVLDWIAHEGAFDHESWVPALAAMRVMNWLRHLDRLLEGAPPEEAGVIERSLRTQIQSLKLRIGLAAEPVDRLLAATALVAAAICETDQTESPDPALIRLNAILAAQIDKDGMHLTRNPRVQMQLLVELASLRGSLGGVKSEAGLEFAAQIERMHEALDALTMGSGEPAYFNGCGHLPQDTLVALQAQGTRRRRRGLIAGYGVLRAGDSVVIADGGVAPPPEFAENAHASALAFEFSHGTELIVGNCGPAPPNQPESRALFRQGIAHSGVTVDDLSANPIPDRGPFAGRLLDPPVPGRIEVRSADHLMTMRTEGYAARFGIAVERRITLMAEGTTLVGQDRLVDAGNKKRKGEPAIGQVAARFHLAPGIKVKRAEEELVRLTLPSGAVWTFLWEGAVLLIDDSVRQSAYLGFHRIKQLVLTARAVPGTEIAWIFTRESG